MIFHSGSDFQVTWRRARLPRDDLCFELTYLHFLPKNSDIVSIALTVGEHHYQNATCFIYTLNARDVTLHVLLNWRVKSSDEPIAINLDLAGPVRDPREIMDPNQLIMCTLCKTEVPIANAWMNWAPQHRDIPTQWDHTLYICEECRNKPRTRNDPRRDNIFLPAANDLPTPQNIQMKQASAKLEAELALEQVLPECSSAEMLNPPY